MLCPVQFYVFFSLSLAVHSHAGGEPRNEASILGLQQEFHVMLRVTNGVKA